MLVNPFYLDHNNNDNTFQKSLITLTTVSLKDLLDSCTVCRSRSQNQSFTNDLVEDEDHATQVFQVKQRASGS